MHDIIMSLQEFFNLPPNFWFNWPAKPNPESFRLFIVCFHFITALIAPATGISPATFPFPSLILISAPPQSPSRHAERGRWLFLNSYPGEEHC